jgi:hypothetical protein
LRKSAYGVKHAALYHLFRLQDSSGYPDTFKKALDNLLRDFFRVVTSLISHAKQQIQDEVAEGEIVKVPNIMSSQWNQVNFSVRCFGFLFYTKFLCLTTTIQEELKEPMIILLLKLLGKWFLLDWIQTMGLLRTVSF